MNLKNKRVLITAGPTWVPIDKVRVISNIATGQTGILLAEEARKLGARVTLLLGPVGANGLHSSIKTTRFKFFSELRDKVVRELRSKKYDLIIHSAAVSDFRPKLQTKGKINSARTYSLKLTPLPKIIQDIKQLCRKAKIVMFKLEVQVSDEALIHKARIAQIEAKANFIVANRIDPYGAFIIDRKGNKFFVHSKKELAKRLLEIVIPTLQRI